MHSSLKAIGLFAASLVIGSVNGWLNPSAPSWSESTLSNGEILIVSAIARTNVLWVDARSESEYLKGSIPAAVLLNEDQWDDLLPGFLSIWQPEQLIVVYCSSQTCQASHGVANRLKSEIGLEEVFVLKGGWEAWQDYD